MRHSLVPLALTALIVLAGCTGAFGGDAAPSNSTTAERVAPGEAALPPGVTPSGLANADDLLAAHDETLRAQGFVLNGTFARNHSGTRSERRQYSAVVAPGADRFRVAVETTLYATTDGSRQVVQRRATRLWSNGSGVTRQRTLDDSTSVTGVDDVPTSLALTRAPQYRTYLELGDYDVERVVRRGGHTYTTLAATGARADVEQTVTVNARFVVDERGVVHEAEVTVHSGSGPDAETDRATYRVVDFGGSPEPPAWVAESSE